MSVSRESKKTNDATGSVLSQTIVSSHMKFDYGATSKTQNRERSDRIKVLSFGWLSTEVVPVATLPVLNFARGSMEFLTSESCFLNFQHLVRLGRA